MTQEEETRYNNMLETLSIAQAEGTQYVLRIRELEQRIAQLEQVEYMDINGWYIACTVCGHKRPAAH